MPNLTTTQIADLVASTLKSYGPLKWTDLSTDLQEMYMLPQILKQKRATIGGGQKIQRQIMTDHSHSAKNVGLYDVANPNFGDYLSTIEVDWRHTMVDQTIERRELLVNSTENQIVQLIKLRKAAMDVALAKQMEDNGWLKGTSDDGVTPFGVLYWANKYASGSATPGFSGTSPFGSNTYCGGLNHLRWKNWAGQYTNVSKADLIAKLRRAFRKCDFKSPVPMPTYATGKARYELFTTVSVLEGMEELAESQNDTLGKDLASTSGNTTFWQTPVRWVPALEDDSHAPIYGIDWNVFQVVFLEGDYMHYQTYQAPNQPNTTVMRVDCTYNTICTDVRRLFVLSTGTDKS
jgi:hypothetical protein